MVDGDDENVRNLNEVRPMSEETARTIVIAITAIGAVAWLAGLTVMLRARASKRRSLTPPPTGLISRSSRERR